MFMYAITTFKRQFHRYWHIICILTFSMIIPLMFNILGSSIGYGSVQEKQSMTNNSDYMIASAPRELLSAFDETQTFIATYTDGNLYLKISDQDYDVNNTSPYSNEIHNVLGSAGLNHLQVYNMTKLQDIDSNTTTFMVQINIITLVIIFITIFIFRTGYRSHVMYFKNEVQILYTLGISTKSIVIFFLWSLTFEFIISYLSAISVAYSSMHLLFANFLEVNSAGYSWMLFYVDWGSIVLLGAVWYSMLVLICFNRMHILKNALLGTKKIRIPRNRKTLNKLGAEKATLEVLWTRCCRPVKHCIGLSVAVCSLAIFLLNYASINAEAIDEDTDADFSLSKNVLIDGNIQGFTNEELSRIESIEGIKAVYRKNVSSVSFLAAQPTGQAINPIFVMHDVSYVSTHLKPLKNEVHNVAAEESSYIPVWVNPHQPGIQYHIGDLVFLYENKPSTIVHQDAEMLVPGLPFLVDRLELQVVGYVDAEYLDGPLELYFEQATYDMLTKDLNPSFIEVYLLDQSTDVQNIEIRLREITNNRIGYNLINLKEQAEISVRTSSGLYLLISLLLMCFLVLTALVVAILLREFVQQQRGANYLFLLMGVSTQHLKQVYKRISLRAFFTTVTVSSLIGSILTWILFANTGYMISLTAGNVMIYTSMLVCLYASMTVPMKIELHKQLNEMHNAEGFYE